MNKTSYAAQIEKESPDPRHSHGSCTEAECIETAQELRLVLEEEAGTLKRFAGADLLKIISRKEFLVSELSQKLHHLREVSGIAPQIPGPLKLVLEKIDEINRSNKYFIQSSLTHWQDLLSLLHPTGYGPTAEGVKGGTPLPKGLAFSREI